MSEDDYTAALLEEVRDQNKRILEAIGSMTSVPNDVNVIKNDVSSLKEDMSDVRSVVKDHSKSIQDHQSRLTILEAV